MLSSVDGDIDKLKNEMLNQRDVSLDAGLATESWASSVEKLKNSWQSFASVGIAESMEIILPIIQGIISGLNSISKIISSVKGLAPGLAAGLMPLGLIIARLRPSLNPIHILDTATALKQTAATVSESIGTATVQAAAYGKKVTELAKIQAGILS